MRYIPRHELEEHLVAAALGGAPRLTIVQAPRGAGKTSLLRQVASRLAARGRLPVLIDVERICISPADFALRFVQAVRNALGGEDSLPTPRALEVLGRLDDELGRRKPDPTQLLQLALSYPGAAAPSDGAPIVLLLDELAEVSRLARHEGLRDAVSLVTSRLAGEDAAIVATISPASRPAALLEKLRRQAGAHLEVAALPPFTDGEMAAFLRAAQVPHLDDPGADETLERWMRATGGRPLYAEILARRVAAVVPGGEPIDLVSALAAEMTPPTGSLHQECRFDYHLLVERSRGHSAVRSILSILAREEGLRLSDIARKLRIQLPTALDYLSWLLEVGLIRRDGAGYVFADPLLRLWVTLNGPDPADLLEEVVRLVETPRRVPQPPSRPRGRRPAAPAVPATSLTVMTPPSGQVRGTPRGAERSRDSLIEID